MSDLVQGRAERIFVAVERLRSRCSNAAIPLLEAALHGDVGAISMLRAREIISLEDMNILHAAAAYRRAVRPVGYQAGVPVYADVYDLLLFLDFLCGDRRHCVFRGHGDSRWSYEPSESRLKTHWEAERWKSARSSFLAILAQEHPELCRGYWEMLACAQHYGFKTMLLDFTTSLHVAAWFAASAPPAEAKTGSIMAISITDFESLGMGEIRVIESPHKNERMRRQKGCFVTRFDANILGERGLFDVYCFRHKGLPLLLDNGVELRNDYLFPEEAEDPLARIASPILKSLRS